MRISEVAWGMKGENKYTEDQELEISLFIQSQFAADTF